MNKADIKERIKVDIKKTKLLINECKSLTKAISPDCAVDHSLRMEKLTEDELTFKTLRKAEQKLINLKRVLHQLDKEKFGICLACKSPIPLQRIVIRPESLYCVECSE